MNAAIARAVSWILGFLERFTGISALPPQVMTYTVVVIWVAGAAGFAPAADFWFRNSGSVTTFSQISIGLWFAYRASGHAVTTLAGRKGSDEPTS